MSGLLNDEQNQAFEWVHQRKNIFLTGPAGTGKSFLINHIKEWAIEKQLKFVITALTGSAALLIHGRTLHSALGIGLGEKPVEQLVSFVLRNKG